MARSVSVQDLIDNTHLDVLHGKDDLNRKITTSDISRPGLELTGYFEYYPSERVQLFGITETSFAKGMTDEQLTKVMTKMCQKDTPCFVISTDLEPAKQLVKAAHDAHIPILRSNLTTSHVLSNMTNYLEGILAERKSLHGVLVEVYGLGVLITGDSGIGKSETALELVKRGHQLVADDRVEVHQQDEQSLIGTSPAILSHLLEIRGIGIIDVLTLFGAGAIRSQSKINLIIHLEEWDKDSSYDRLGTDTETERIFDVDVKKMRIPVKPGRNLAIIIETAAINYRAHSMGYDATDVFDKNLKTLIKKNEADDKAKDDPKDKSDDDKKKSGQ